MDILTCSVAPSWKVFRLGQLFHERKTKVSDKDYEPLSVTMKGIVTQLETAAKSDDSENRKLVLKGDYAINSRSDRKGAGGISPLDGSVSLISIVLEPNGIVPEFAHHLLRSTAFQEEFYRWGHGIVADLWTTRYADMKNIRLALPDLPTQNAIADFLDRETARIDQLIEKKQRMLEVLGERLCAERESSVWVNTKLAKLGHHINIISGYAFPSDGFSHDPDDFRLLRGANVGVDSLRWDDVVYWPADDTEQLKRFRLQIGDLVMGMDRPWISGGMRVATVGPGDVPSFLLQRVCKIKPRATMNHAFLKELLHSRRFLAYFEPILTGVSVPHISSDQITNFRFPYVAPDVQASKMEHFKKLAYGVRMAINTTNISIGRLREFRSALITAAVTGQIDVSTWSKQGTTGRRLDQIEEATSA